ncbi:MAG: TlpA disulfide reductase family protein [Ancalomicrobiaceae bacterium]|nr:TlpA disulfide reductase family protein [Ancalomicrobiaceae bacterium]
MSEAKPMPQPRPRRRRPLTTSVVSALIVAAAAVYGIWGLSGNAGLIGPDGKPLCVKTPGVVARVKPAIHGQVAGLVPAAQPLSLSQLTFDTADGNKASLAQWAGRTVLLNLWATWCGPCRAEMPALDRLQAAKGDKDFEVVAVNIDTVGAEKPKKFLADIGVSALPFRSDASLGIFKALQKVGRSRGLPTTILVDGEGCEIATMYGSAEWDRPDALTLVDAAIGK